MVGVDLPPGGAPSRSLTPRQRDVLRGVAAGGTNREIARALGIGHDTVAHHLAAAYRRLGVRNRTGAVVATLAHKDG